MFGEDGLVTQMLQLGWIVSSVLLFAVFIGVTLWLIWDGGKSVSFALSQEENRLRHMAAKIRRHGGSDRDRRRAEGLFMPLTYLYTAAVAIFVGVGVANIFSWVPLPAGDGTPAQLLFGSLASVFTFPTLLLARNALKREAEEHYLIHYMAETKRQLETISCHLAPESCVELLREEKEDLILKLKDPNSEEHHPRRSLKLLPDGEMALIGTVPGSEKHRLKTQARLDVLSAVIDSFEGSASLRVPKLAWRGDVEAQRKLGDMLAAGQGLKQDYVEAYKWWSIAAAQGNGAAVQNIDRLSKRMTAAQISEAQRLASDWKPTE